MEWKSSSRLCLKSDCAHWIFSYCSNVHWRKWKKSKRPDTDQLERCRSDRAGSADRGIFVILDTEGEEKRRKTAKQDGKKKSVRRSFQASSLETATSTRATGAASVHRQHRYNPRQSRPDSGRPLPQASPFKDRVSGRASTQDTQTHFREKRSEDRREQRAERGACVWQGNRWRACSHCGWIIREGLCHCRRGSKRSSPGSERVTTNPNH